MLFLEIFAAILPDIVIKVLENLRDVELIRKEKEDEQSRIDRAKTNLKNKLNSKENYEIGNIEGFHSSSANSARSNENGRLFTPVEKSNLSEQKPSSGRKDKVFVSPISPSNQNSSTNSFNFINLSESSNKISDSNFKSNELDLKKRKKNGQANRNFSVEEIK